VTILWRQIMYIRDVNGHMYNLEASPHNAPINSLFKLKLYHSGRRDLNASGTWSHALVEGKIRYMHQQGDKVFHLEGRKFSAHEGNRIAVWLADLELEYGP